MNGRRPVFPFDLRAVRFAEDGQEWVLFGYAIDGEGVFSPAVSPAERDVLACMLERHSNAAIHRENRKGLLPNNYKVSIWSEP
jgi:hypothetical protein